MSNVEDDKDMVVCVPVDPAYANQKIKANSAVVGFCSMCCGLIFISNESITHMKESPRPTFLICVPCFVNTSPEEIVEQIGIMPAQKESLKKMGYASAEDALNDVKDDMRKKIRRAGGPGSGPESPACPSTA